MGQPREKEAGVVAEPVPDRREDPGVSTTQADMGPGDGSVRPVVVDPVLPDAPIVIDGGAAGPDPGKRKEEYLERGPPPGGGKATVQGGPGTKDVAETKEEVVVGVESTTADDPPVVTPAPEEPAACIAELETILDLSRVVLDVRSPSGAWVHCDDGTLVALGAGVLEPPGAAQVGPDETVRAQLGKVDLVSSAVAFDGEGQVWVTPRGPGGVGEPVTVTTAEDVVDRPLAGGGSTDLAPSFEMPAVAALFLWAGAAAALALRWALPPVPERPPGDPATPVLDSDAPVATTRDDRLDLAPLARAIAAFLRSPDTQGPLTVAVTGPWGSGKSSLMHMVEDQLRRSHARPAWFNAWHHQDESTLVAAMIEQLIRDVPPPLLSPAGMEVRARLARLRLARAVRRSWLGVVALATMHAALAALLLGAVRRWDVFVDAFLKLLDMEPDSFTTLHEGMLSTLAASPVLALGYRMLRAAAGTLGARPDAVLVALRDTASVAATARRVELTNAFARDFGDLCESLEPQHRVVLFVDDIDRCSAAQVAKVLEGVSFLAGAGRCFVVLGMSKEFVVSAVESLLEGEQERKASEYLEKIVNVEVAMPRRGATELAALERPPAGVTEEGGDAGRPGMPLWARAVRKLLGAPGRRVGFVSLVLLGLAVGARTGWDLAADLLPRERQRAGDDGAKLGASAAPPAPTGEVEDKGSVDPTQGGTAAPVTPPDVDGTGVEPSTSEGGAATRQRSSVPLRVPSWPWWAGLAFLGVGALLARVRMARAAMTPDPPALREALARWRPLVVAVNPTPRAWRRFANAARFEVMQRAARRAKPDLSWEQAEIALRPRSFLSPADVIHYVGHLATDGTASADSVEPAASLADIDVGTLVGRAALRHALGDAVLEHAGEGLPGTEVVRLVGGRLEGKAGLVDLAVAAMGGPNI